MKIHVVYADMPNGERFALQAFKSEEKLKRYTDKITRREKVPGGDEKPSAAETLGIRSVSVHILEVEE